MTLLPNATVTILIDGLIYMAYNETKRLYQAGVHIAAQGHHVVVEVRADGNPELLFPTEQLPWLSSHADIKRKAPFWLYVDSGNGLPTSDFSASLYMPADPNDPQSFGHTFSFEDSYHRGLDLELELLAEFNFPHGTCYAAEQERAKLILFDQGGDPHNPYKLVPITVSSLTGIDIASTSGQVKKWIVLVSKEKEEFRFPLNAGHHYQIMLMNVPTDPDETGDPTRHNPEEHFLQFYELFDLNPGEKKYLVEPDITTGTDRFPPCTSPIGSRVRGLAGRK